MTNAQRRISAVVCTRNRGASATATIESILANTHPCFDVILVDQSTNDDTEEATRTFRADPRFHYIRTPTQGLGRARNIGLEAATAEVVAYTDDDCTVPSNWLDVIARAFEQHDRIAVVYCNVAAAPHDSTKGFIPTYVRQESRLVRTLWQKARSRGIGAGLAVRRAPILAIGGFDDLLGAGGMFPSCEDGDITVRALAKGYLVFETHEVAVLHFGFRTWEQGRELTRRDWIGVGAAYAKLLRTGHWGGLAVILYEGLLLGFFTPLAALLRWHKPQGFRRLIYLAEGLRLGLRMPVDPETIRFRLPYSATADQQSEYTLPSHTGV
ncbi:MAG: glycosyltransferase family 2 protein [Chloroflexi bacterium OHK40]